MGVAFNKIISIRGRDWSDGKSLATLEITLFFYNLTNLN